MNRDALLRALCSALTADVALVERAGRAVVLLPVEDTYGDSLAVGLEERDDGFVVSDEGFTIRSIMDVTGTTKPTADLWRRVGEIAHRHGITFAGGELYAVAPDVESLGRALLSLSSSMSEALYLGHSLVTTFGIRFDEEVGLYLRDHQINYLADITIYGPSKAPHTVDFIIPNSKDIVAQAIASEQSMRRALNIFYDLTENNDEFVPVAFVDEQRQGYSNSTFTQLSYKANVFMWGQRERFVDYWRRAHTTAPRDPGTIPIPGTE